MRVLALALAFAVVLLAGRSAAADEPPPRPALAVDDCPVRDPALSEDDLRRQGAEHYTRGETLYVQGDYLGAVQELVASYCKIPYYSILKDIGQAYERNLDYELAIAYLERYVEKIPLDAKRSSPCAADPQEDRENVSRRIKVLQNLSAHILIQTQPKDARITIENKRRIQARARSGEDLAIPANTYLMRVERPGYVTETREITVQIGKPYTFSVELAPETGKLAIQATPADARIFLDDRLVGIGRYDAELSAKRYTVTLERPGRITVRRAIEVLPNQVTRVPVELSPVPQFGRRQLLVFATIAGGAATGALLYAFDETSISGFGSLGGGAAALAGTYLYLDDVALGTSNLTITSTLAATAIGTATTLLFTDEQRVVQPVAGASAIIGGGLGYYLGDRTRIRPGDAALINSSLGWGAAAGGLFALSFGPPREIAAGLVLSGLGLGGISGVVMTRYFDISRTHAALIDVGGIVGILGGLAIESIAYPTSGERFSDEQREHLANFSLAGMAVGLIGAGILTRKLDAPKLNLAPTIGHATGPDGSRTTIYGLGGTW